jgi:hypothetical protein
MRKLPLAWFSRGSRGVENVMPLAMNRAGRSSIDGGPTASGSSDQLAHLISARLLKSDFAAGLVR